MLKKISRQWFLAAGIASAATSATAESSLFFSRDDIDFSLITPGDQYQPQSQRPATRQVSKAEAMRQRTSSSRPIYEQSYVGTAPVGTIMVSINDTTLYHVSGRNTVTAYPIAAGPDSRSLIGKTLRIGRKKQWPTWKPTKNIARRLGIAQKRYSGGPHNPMGAFALYLYNGSQDTIFRVHGTNAPETIGNPNASSGCIRMYNEDVTYLQKFISVGAQVTVYQGQVPGVGPTHRQALKP